MSGYTYPNYNLTDQQERDLQYHLLSRPQLRSGKNYGLDWNEKGGKRSRRAHSKRRAHRKSHRKSHRKH